MQLLAELLSQRFDEQLGMFDVLAISSRLLNERAVSAETVDMLDRLARKIEIAGIVYRQYSIEENRLIPLGDVATSEEIGALLAAYLVAFDRTGDRRHLNTVLKAIDGALSQQRIACFHELDYLCARRLGEHG